MLQARGTSKTQVSAARMYFGPIVLHPTIAG